MLKLKLKRHNKIHDYHCKTQPDEPPHHSSHKLDTSDPQQRLFQISLKTNEQQFAGTFTVWSKKIAKTQTINLLSPIDMQEGCLNKTLSNLKTNIVMLNKKEFQLKKWKDKKYRESQVKKSILSNQRKKSCVPINFNLQNYDNKKHSTRIHSRTYSTSFYTTSQPRQENLRCRSQICCNLEVPLPTKEEKKEREQFITIQKDYKRAQNQLVVHKKRAKTLRQTNHTDQQQSNFRQHSYSKYFNILNFLIGQQKKKVLFPLRRLCPTTKMKGIFQKRRHSVNK